MFAKIKEAKDFKIVLFLIVILNFGNLQDLSLKSNWLVLDSMQ